MIARRCTVVVLVAGSLVGIPAPAAAAPGVPSAKAQRPGVLHLQTVPTIAGVTVEVDGQTARSDAQGRIAVRVQNFVGLSQRLAVPKTQVSPDRTVVFDRFRGDPDSGVHGTPIELGIRTSRLVSWRFLDRLGGEVPTSRVQSMRLRSNTGEILDLTGPTLAQSLWVPESRTQQGPSGLVSKQLYYVVDTAVVNGVSVVNRAQQRFIPWERQQWLVQLLFFKVSFSSSDLLFAGRAGEGVELTRPDGTVQRLPFGRDGTVVLPDLPRGTYNVRVFGGGVSFPRPVSISKDQEVALQVLSVLDLALIGSMVLFVACGLVVFGRRGRIPPIWRRWWRLDPRWPRWRAARAARASVSSVVAVAFLLATVVGATLPARPAHAKVGPTPVLAYYYIWFNPTSWQRAKIDYPLAGRYSSDDPEIMRRHVRMAKAAGIDGFLVSWKHTPQLDERLAKLVSIAREESFRLGIVYQGLDFSRTPLPLTTVREDLKLFADQYANDLVFNVLGKPIVVWTGSERFTSADLDGTVHDLRGRLLVLGDAKSTEDSIAMAPAVDGQAYYWSSADPTNGTSRDKLAAMAQAVHQRGGIWIAPVAPGFDARLVGGTRTVARRDGETLRQSFAAALSSNPDVVGVISWNEFSENTHIEPSEWNGARELTVLAELLGGRVDIGTLADSSDPGDDDWGLTSVGALVFLGAVVALFPVCLAIWRRRRAGAAAQRLIDEFTPIEEQR